MLLRNSARPLIRKLLTGPPPDMSGQQPCVAARSRGEVASESQAHLEDPPMALDFIKPHSSQGHSKPCPAEAKAGNRGTAVPNCPPLHALPVPSCLLSPIPTAPGAPRPAGVLSSSPAPHLTPQTLLNMHLFGESSPGDAFLILFRGSARAEGERQREGGTLMCKRHLNGLPSTRAPTRPGHQACN